MVQKNTISGLFSRCRHSFAFQNRLTAYVMLLPVFVLMTVFVIVPLISTIVLSFFDWSFYQESIFVGLNNYYKVISDKVFWQSILVGLEYTICVIPIQLVLAFFISNAIRLMGRRVSSFVKAAVYIPNVISGIIASYIFLFIFNFRGGLANYLLSLFGIEAQAWTSSPKLALFCIVLPGVWLGLGVTTLIMLAGLNDIPQDYYEAADIDGANTFRKMISITIPCLKNVTVYLIVTGTTSAMQMFELSQFITGGGPLNKTMMPVLLIYNHFNSDPYMGYTMSAALLLFAILGSISMIVFRTINSEKSIDG